MWLVDFKLEEAQPRMPFHNECENLMKLFHIVSYKTVPSSPSILQYGHEDRRAEMQDSLLIPVTCSLHIGATLHSDQTAERSRDENSLHLRAKCDCESTRQSGKHQD